MRPQAQRLYTFHAAAKSLRLSWVRPGCALAKHGCAQILFCIERNSDFLGTVIFSVLNEGEVKDEAPLVRARCSRPANEGRIQKSCIQTGAGEKRRTGERLYSQFRTAALAREETNDHCHRAKVLKLAYLIHRRYLSLRYRYLRYSPGKYDLYYRPVLLRLPFIASSEMDPLGMFPLSS